MSSPESKPVICLDAEAFLKIYSPVMWLIGFHQGVTGKEELPKEITRLKRDLESKAEFFANSK